MSPSAAPEAPPVPFPRPFTAPSIAVTGSTHTRDIRLLEHQRPVFGAVASHPTVWRTLKEADAQRLSRIERARGAVRRRVYELLRERPEGFPEVEVEGVSLAGRLDRDRQRRHPDPGTVGEGGSPRHLQGVPRTPHIRRHLRQHRRTARRDAHPGIVSANDTGVNIDILTRAVAQLPWWRRQKILFRVDGAGFSHQLIDWIASASGRKSPTFRWENSVGWAPPLRQGRQRL
ncbi:hypothetical protein KUM39_18985 [Streptomyces sp. J2-1]|uniref:hypothetical protein n=1 Tax=Streptomyces corallincola TaxID=2851888 RepID=UPI001C37F06C|nr:hypothetical protein [Streptomyces corallincola]MBV2356437.1 hypothetical protein [Streptomyces corallincola]